MKFVVALVLALMVLGAVRLFRTAPPSPSSEQPSLPAALRFVPVSRLEAEGYGQYLPLFQATADVSR